ncbi:MAG: hypothetical protein V4649_10450 [Bacteroidota bacterium]
MIRSVLLVALCCGIAATSGAQVITRSTDTAARNKPVARVNKVKGPKPITNEVSFGLRLHSNGWSAYTDIGKVSSKDAKRSDMFYNVKFLQVELSEMKSPRQEKFTGDESSGSGSSSYIYGKVNNMYALKLGVGLRKMIAGKPDPGSVSVHWVNVLGASLGMVKPYYINTLSDPTAIKYSDDNKDYFLDQRYIMGSAGFSKGLGEMKYVPGGHFKSAIHFDFAANRKNVLGVEAGFDAQFYSQQVMIMANQPPTNYFVDLFIAVQLGKRW